MKEVGGCNEEYLMKDRIEISVEAGVADVRLVRSDKMNALDQRMFSALAEAGKQLASMKDVRVVVLSGEGRAFCAGHSAIPWCPTKARESMAAERKRSKQTMSRIGSKREKRALPSSSAAPPWVFVSATLPPSRAH